MLDKIKALLNKGIALPILRDVVTGKPSITYTGVVISLVLASLAVSEAASKALGNLSFSDALSLYVASSFLYLGRKFQSKGGSIVSDDSQS